MVSQVSLDCEPCLAPENVGEKDGDSGVPSSSQDPAAPRMPAKKQTRQWAAWTRQEEESFFAALRQVGKNFEKITCRVQSKNKDQVRHYYYRLVRRMNKLLGPELCLDAKNSKDTNAAMLRWWSLLEKYSCKASKLHLKPRRFKIFVETLENQLLKDRKKNVRKRLSTGENTTSIQQLPASHQVRASGHDNRAVKMALVDNQNIQKVGTGKGPLSKRPINVGLDRSNCKVDPASMKSAKLRRKDGKFGLASTAAYKRWEKAAIAGVSLVADAAEHLEREDTDKEIEHVQQIPGNYGSQHIGEVVHPRQRSSESMHNENNVNNSTKLKLQLFPIDESTRKALEMDHHNPHLELTLSTKKKISSVLEHLIRKWGNSSLLSQEMMLFPYWAQRENLMGYQKWTKDSPHCASDVYYLIGSPPVFRLRYGWFSKAEIESMTAQALSCNNLNEQNTNRNVETEDNAETENPSGPHNDQLVSIEQMIAMNTSSSSRVETVDCGVPVNVNSSPYHDRTAVVSSLTSEVGDFAVTRQVQNAKDTAFSAGEWADSLTNISVGDLLSESAQNMDINCSELPLPVGSSCLQQTPFSCDSFDAAIAAHIYKHQNKDDVQQDFASSLWDAEETCDAFAFQKNGLFCDIGQTSSRNEDIDVCKQTTIRSTASGKDEELPEADIITNTDLTPEKSPKDIGGITDLYWPDSLGPLDLDIPSCRYPSNDLILSDSLGGLNRLIANSLDAFQSCSFFGLDKKESAPTSDQARQTASFSDFKIGGEV